MSFFLASVIIVFTLLISLDRGLTMLSVDHVKELLILPDQVKVLEGRIEGESGSFEYSGAQGLAASAGC